MQITIDRILKKSAAHITITAENESDFETMELDGFLDNKELVKKIAEKYDTDKYVIKERGTDNISKPILGDIEITKDNIHLYYEFMSDEDLKKFKKELSYPYFIQRSYQIKDALGLSNYELESENYIWNKVVRGEQVLTLASATIDASEELVGCEYFGVKDTLKPIDEYINEIKSSLVYQTYLKEKDSLVESGLDKLHRYISETNETIKEAEDNGENATGYYRALRELEAELEEWKIPDITQKNLSTDSINSIKIDETMDVDKERADLAQKVNAPQSQNLSQN